MIILNTHVCTGAITLAFQKNVEMKTVVRFVGIICVVSFKQSPVVETMPNWIEKPAKRKRKYGIA